MKPYVGSMWRHLAEAFRGDRVWIILNRKSSDVGRVVSIGPDSFEIERDDGRRRRIDYADLSSIEIAK